MFFFFEVGPDTNVRQLYLVQCYSLSLSHICHGELCLYSMAVMTVDHNGYDMLEVMIKLGPLCQIFTLV